MTYINLLIPILLIAFFFLFIGQYSRSIDFFFIFGCGYILGKTADILNLKHLKTPIYILLWFHVLGSLLFYFTIQHYDKFLHFMIPFFITLIFYDYVKERFPKNPKLAIFFIVFGMLIWFELLEYFVDIFLDSNMQGTGLLTPLKDTVYDVVAGIFGIGTFLIFKKNKEFLKYE